MGEILKMFSNKEYMKYSFLENFSDISSEDSSGKQKLFPVDRNWENILNRVFYNETTTKIFLTDVSKLIKKGAFNTKVSYEKVAFLI